MVTERSTTESGKLSAEQIFDTRDFASSRNRFVSTMQHYYSQFLYFLFGTFKKMESKYLSMIQRGDSTHHWKKYELTDFLILLSMQLLAF
ncbi:MAG TPA: hypothetical protein O0X40_04085 [Methanocorpusculum sp.]|nr:hypothetical protein [Methanocorpusculum sp.]HJJ57346.1 hypothetical protein [Methanocorpusculum sp.]